MIKKLIVMFRIAAAVASYPLWTLAAAWLSTPRGALVALAAGLAAAVDAVAEWGGGTP